MGCTVFWQCKIYHWDNSVRLLAIPMHTDLRLLCPVECDFFLILFSYDLVSGVYQGATVWFGGWGWGLGSFIVTDCFQHELGQKIYFQVFRCRNTYFHPQQNLEKEKKLMVGGRLNRGEECFLKRETGQDFPRNL